MKALLYDTINTIRRVFEAGQRAAEPVDQAQFIRSAVASIRRAIREVDPTHVCCVFDGEGPTWRHTLYPAYKAGREPPSEMFQAGCAEVRQQLIDAGIFCFSKNGYECDDIVASLATKLKQHHIATVIVSTDKDFSQLLSDLIRQYDHFHKDENQRLRTPDWVANKFGVSPEKFTDVQALAGDTADNIPGVPGIGPKFAAGYIERFKSLEKVIKMADYLVGKKGQAIREHITQLRLSHQLVTLKTDIHLGINLKDFVYHPAMHAPHDGIAV